jgi:hypothetical protein
MNHIKGIAADNIAGLPYRKHPWKAISNALMKIALQNAEMR